jgi:hypothetical protein
VSNLFYVGSHPEAEAAVVTREWVLNAITSGGLDVKMVGGEVNGVPTSLTLWVGTAAQYAAIAVKSGSTIYVVTS